MISPFYPFIVKFKIYYTDSESTKEIFELKYLLYHYLLVIYRYIYTLVLEIFYKSIEEAEKGVYNTFIVIDGIGITISLITFIHLFKKYERSLYY